MRLPSLFRRAPSGRATDPYATEPSFSSSRSSAPSLPTSDETIAALRTRARRRLIGATVLVAAAVVSLPWLFESQPRPLPVDLPIELQRKDASPVATDARGAVAEVDTPPSVVAGAASADGATAGIAQPTHADQAPKPPPARASHPAVAQAPVPSPVPPVTTAPDGPRALALLDGKPVSPPASSTAGVRYIVQIGAFAEADAVSSARSKAERLGLKTYTQVIDAAAGRRTRVRVGPYVTKAEAEHAVSQLKTAGLLAVVLTL